MKGHYKKIKEKGVLKQIFQGRRILNSRMKTGIVRESLGTDQIKIRQTTPKLLILRETIKLFLDLTMYLEPGNGRLLLTS